MNYWHLRTYFRTESNNPEGSSNAILLVWYRPTQGYHLLVPLHYGTAAKRKTCIVPERLYFRIASLYFICSPPLWDSLLYLLTLHSSSGLVYITTWISSRITACSSLLCTHTSLIEQILSLSGSTFTASLVKSNPILKMHISDMLNPENHSEEAYSSLPQAHTRTRNSVGTNIPRSTLLPATQLSSLPPTHSYCRGYDSYNTASQPHQAPPIGARLYEISSPATFSLQPRNLAVDSAAGGSSGGYGNSPCGYVPTQTNPSGMPMPISRSLGATSQDRPSQNRDAMSSSQGLYTHTQSPGTNPLTALATLATSRDFRGNNGRSNEHHRWDHESTTWGRQAVSEGYPHEVQLRRGSQPFSPYDTANDAG